MITFLTGVGTGLMVGVVIMSLMFVRWVVKGDIELQTESTEEW